MIENKAMKRKTAVLFALLVWCSAELTVPATVTAAPPDPHRDHDVIAQQNRELDPQANAVDPVTGRTRFRPLPPPAHHGHDRTGTPTASDLSGSGTAAATTAAAAVENPAQIGSWAAEAPFGGEQNMNHVVCSPTGKCLFVVGLGRTRYQSYVYNPTTRTKKLVTTPDDLFCAGHVLLPDGRALVVGGTLASNPWRGTKTVYAFNFVTEQYEKLRDMAVGRWYPSVVTMQNGRQLITSGFDTAGAVTNLVEVFDPRTNTATRLTPTRRFPLYPRTYQTNRPGWIFNAGPRSAGFWNPTTGAFTPVAQPSAAGSGNYGSCFFGDVRRQNLMIMGGGWPATAATHVIDLDSTTPAYRAGPPLSAAKAYVSCVNLPDGSLFEANGGWDNRIEAASRNTGLLTSLAGPWRAMSPLPQGEHRLYHSLLYLQDDGRVVSIASNPAGGESVRSRSHLVYSPPYLARGARPAITRHTTEVRYGGTYRIGTSAPAGRTVRRITVTTAPSATHSVDLNQRYLSLRLSNGSITFPSRRVMPPGWYRIWAVDSANVPSVAKWVHIR